MATKDKLINLEDLKVLSDHVEGEVTDLKSDLTTNAQGIADLHYSTENKTIHSVQGMVALTPGQSILADNKIMDCYIPANMTFRIMCTSTATISGNVVNAYGTKADNTIISFGAITLGEYKYLRYADAYIAISLYISDSNITSAGDITVVAEYLEENPNATETEITRVKKALSPFVKSVKSPNIFTWWQEGYLSEYANGRMVLDTTQQLCSAGFIPVKPSTEYTILDPDSISANARNAQYAWEYDENRDYIQKISASSGSIVTSATTRYLRLSSQSVGTQGYIIGDYANYKTMVVEGNDYYAAYIPPIDVATDIGIENTNYPMVGGVDSQNLFAGNSFVCGGINYSTGKVDAGTDVLCTPLIPISEDLYWYLLGGKNEDIRFVFEYNASKSLVKNYSVTGIYGHVTLDNSTKYIRLRSQTNGTGSYVMTTTAFLDEHLIVSSSPIKYYHDNKPILSRVSVSDDFADSAIYLNEFDGEKDVVDNYVRTIETTAYDVVVPIITDVHFDKTTPYDLHNYLSASGFADVLFNLGDNIPNHYSTKNEAIDTLKMVFHEEYLKPGKNECYVLCGNHDYNPVNDNAVANTINQQLYYSLSQARLKKGYAGFGKNYGFIDLDGAKVRLIWLDSGDIFDNTTGEPLTTGMNTIVQQEQFTWFCNVALDFTDKVDRSEWAVVTLSHDSLSSLSNGGFATVINAFMNGTTAQGTAYCVGRGSTIPQAYDVDFTAQGAIEYICHLNGHYHEDNVIDLGNTGRKQISIACDNLTAYHYVDGEKVEYTRTPGTIEMHCIDTFCLDRKNKTITMKRLGVGVDRSISYA